MGNIRFAKKLCWKELDFLKIRIQKNYSFLLVISFVFFQISNGAKLISNCASLMAISSNMNGSYVLTNNIDCKTVFGGPIGNTSIKGYFTGILDGQGTFLYPTSFIFVTFFPAGFSIQGVNLPNHNHNDTAIFTYGKGARVSNLVISNFSICCSASNNFGSLFAYCDGCTISNVTIAYSLIHSLKNSGGICGVASNSVFTNCVVSSSTIGALQLSSNSGGVVGLAINCSISKCYNLGFADASNFLFDGCQNASAIVGVAIGCNVSQCGVHSGSIRANTYGVTNVGTIVGFAVNCPLLDQLYAHSEVSVSSFSSTNPNEGFSGLIGSALYDMPANYILSNFYSKATINAPSSTAGGIIGCLEMANLTLNMSSGYYYNLFPNARVFGNIIGTFTRSKLSTLDYSQVWSLKNSHNQMGSEDIHFATLSLDSSPLCTNLQTFNQQIWSADVLLSEYNFSLHNFKSFCESVLSLSRSSLAKTIDQAKSIGASSKERSLTAPPLTKAPSACVYNVPNCHFCASNPPNVSSSLASASCQLYNGSYTWSFTPPTGNFSTNDTSLVFTSSQTFFSGDFVEGTGGRLTFVVDYATRLIPVLIVEHCVHIEGKIWLNLSSPFQSGNYTFPLIRFLGSCSKRNSITPTQYNGTVIIKPNYNRGSCDQYGYTLYQTGNTLCCSLSSTVGSLCSTNLGLKIGLAVGLPLLAAFIVVGFVFYCRRRDQKKATKYAKEYNMKQMN